MTDLYMKPGNALNRLKKVFDEHKCIIIAYDFDDTVYNCFNNPDADYSKVHELLRRYNPYAKFIVFTSSGKDRYEFIANFLEENGLPYSEINGDIVDLGFEARKPYYNVLLDDKAGLSEVYNMLNVLYGYIMTQVHSYTNVSVSLYRSNGLFIEQIVSRILDCKYTNDREFINAIQLGQTKYAELLSYVCSDIVTSSPCVTKYNHNKLLRL